ncbi:hypothetical protein I4U23_020913 [Adineta vaga]|nr:hypothetical protein I4U23_020913 [Adineta vaga]
MYKKSITRIEKENESSQTELSNPVLQDIIATNHVVLSKKSHEERLSRACKAVIIMIILGLISIGVIILTVVLAHSRNSLMAIVSRSLETNFSQISNNTRLLFLPKENLTTISNEQRENENWRKTTVSLTSYNLPMLTTANVHISSSSSIMRTEQQNEYTSHPTSTIKSSISTNKITNEQTVTKYIRQTTDTSKVDLSTIIQSTEELITTMKSQEHLSSTSNNLDTSIIDSTSTLVSNTITSSTPEETSFIAFISRHFNIESSTMTMNQQTQTTGLMDKLRANIEDDVIHDLLFS